MKIFVLFLLLVSFVGCATPPTKRYFPRDEVKNIEVGKTTQKDIYEAFGMPLHHGRRGEDDWWMYIHTLDENSESLSLYFNNEGKVSDFFYSPFRQSLEEKMAAR
ncbi:MAG: outer membrane protein assembly factor BamE [Deltaproteobacteria bacterium]|nr:outer membrane protein assembly factor BamE [Deltaproteobacteria bacterium]MBI3016846.1 outer membrane protein assembly factor BamE [Deltaproteobacteria bacterium]